MPCSACKAAKERRKQRLESRRRHDAERQRIRQQQIAEAKERGSKVVYRGNDSTDGEE